MAIYLPLDAETIVDPKARACYEPVKPDARLKDPIKIEESIREKTQERDEKLSVDIDGAMICALGYTVVGRGDPVCHVMSNEQEERENLMLFRDFYNDLNKRNEVVTVTFFGLKFDLPLLKRRAMYLDIPNFPKFNVDRYRSSHIDVWWELSERGQVTAHGLKFYAKRLGLTTLDKVDGADIAQLVKDENWAAIEAHCLSDVGLCHAIANRLGLLKV